MKKITTLFLILSFTSVFACGGGDYWGSFFFNLFSQKNISDSSFYPFLRDDENTFFEENNYYYPKDENKIDNIGNVELWQKLLTTWSLNDIENAVYYPEKFNWSKKEELLDRNVKAYLDFAHECSNTFRYRKKRSSWDYDKILDDKNIEPTTLISKATNLLKGVKNQQLKQRYYYQIIRIFHYTKNWNDAIAFFESKIENKTDKDEIYYYILDQVAGCYYSTKKYEKAAFLFTKVLNNSIDRKKSAFISFSFCTGKDADGKSLIKTKEDQKDYALITSLRELSNLKSSILNFVKLDVNDSRLELLFIRFLSNRERELLDNNIGVHSNTLLNSSKLSVDMEPILFIAEDLSKNEKVENKEFWKITSSYLSFLSEDLQIAKQKLEKVVGFSKQKKILTAVYETFGWDKMTKKREDSLRKILARIPEEKTDEMQQSVINDSRDFILHKVAHLYYKNDELAKSFLVHNNLENLPNINSLELLNALEVFYNKPDKTAFENTLVSKTGSSLNKNNISYLDFIYHQKGIYFLLHKDPALALKFLEKRNNFKDTYRIPNSVFSNNIKECFSCDTDDVMKDEVYKASVFSFIKPMSSRVDLAKSVLELERMTDDEKKWKRKLAHYLLGNFYYNISNTGFYRGVIVNGNNCCDYNFIDYANYKYKQTTFGHKVIKNRAGYNLSNVAYFNKTYFALSDLALKHYYKTIELSADRELNARCLYLIAKCELNSFYNIGSKETFEVKISEYRSLTLPNYKSFKLLKNQYSDTKFHDMIIKDCSYFKMYSSQ